MASRTLWLGEIAWSRNQVSMVYGVDDLRFSTAYWYSDVDLAALERAHGSAFLRRLLFHALAFEANKAGSLRPDRFDPGPYADLVTAPFWETWSTVFRHVWAQWRFENGLPDYTGPQLDAEPAPVAGDPLTHAPGEVEVLAFCGGGKDSLVCLDLLERAGIPASSFAYSHSIYGQAAKQHRLIDGLLDHLEPRRRHRQWVYDDFLDSPVTDLRPDLGVATLTAAETPSSLFAALPVALTHGYTGLALAHERSADFGNLRWDLTDEDVNHQWGKSLEAEVILQRYVRETLLSEVSYFSVLKPVYDLVIFNALNRRLDAVPATHSCNIDKPWCERCPKCAYVWLNYMAYLPVEVVRPMFRTNLLDTPENELWFRQMLGLEAHTPFECVGQVDEAQLAFELCRRKGVTGRMMDVYADEVGPVDPEPLIARYLVVDDGHHAIPAPLAARILGELHAARELTQSQLAPVLAAGRGA